MQGRNAFFRITPDEANAPCVFAVTRGQIENRIDPHANNPKFRAAFAKLNKLPIVSLKQCAEKIFSGLTPKSGGNAYTDENDGVLFVKSGCLSNDGTITFDETSKIKFDIHNVLMKSSKLKQGDVLIAIVGATIGKVGLYNSNREANINQAIAAIRLKDCLLPEFLVAYMLSPLGQTYLEYFKRPVARANINLQEIGEIGIPFLSIEKQIAFVEAFNSVKANKDSKLKQAEEYLVSFNGAISKQFNLNANSNSNVCFAIRLKQLDGVIDVKRYKNTGSNHNLTIGDVCDIVEQKVNASSYGTNIIDWIRIDDLPNFPLDIEQMRTQQANEIEGSFFEVKENDILLARLGPTILNKKIVLVRKLQRLTIASSEFLVLRCKEGYNPETVMAILKTDYYKNLMYSYARGSTPSRYRLNRDDVLKLPFPNITEVQDDLAQNAFALREEVKAMRKQAEHEWQEAKAQFEKELLTN